MSVSWPSPDELADLVARFRGRTLPKGAWTHEAHVAVGLWHVRRFGANEAIHQLRDGIRRLNDAHGTPNTATSGYHETITRAYVTLIAGWLEQGRTAATDAEAVQALLASPLAHRKALLEYYSNPLISSSHARAVWVDPDVRPFP